MVEQKQTNSLMKKTKSQLIDIILRKDDIEVELQEKIRKADNDYKELLDTNNQNYYNVESVKNQLKFKTDRINELLEENASLQNKIEDNSLQFYKLEKEILKLNNDLVIIKNNYDKLDNQYEKLEIVAGKVLFGCIASIIVNIGLILYIVL